MKYYYLFFLKKGLLLLTKHFETSMSMLPKNIFLLCHSTVHHDPVNIHIIRGLEAFTRMIFFQVFRDIRWFLWEE